MFFVDLSFLLYLKNLDKFYIVFEFNFLELFILIELVILLLLNIIFGLEYWFIVLVVKCLKFVWVSLFEEILNEELLLNKVSFLIFFGVLFGLIMLLNIKFFSDLIFLIFEKLIFIG